MTDSTTYFELRLNYTLRFDKSQYKYIKYDIRCFNASKSFNCRPFSRETFFVIFEESLEACNIICIGSNFG